MPWSTGQRVVRQGRGDRLAIQLYDLIRDASENDLRLILDALHARGDLVRAHGEGDDESLGLDAEEGNERRRRFAVESLARAASELGEIPSYRRYEVWRREQPDPSEVATPSLILRRLGGGSWTTAVEMLGGPRRDVLARRLLSNGIAFSAAECEEALRLFLEQIGKREPTKELYRRWARDYARGRDAQHVPLDTNVIARRLGRTWRELTRAQP